jgi:hypothetical protein
MAGEVFVDELVGAIQNSVPLFIGRRSNGISIADALMMFGSTIDLFGRSRWNNCIYMECNRWKTFRLTSEERIKPTCCGVLIVRSKTRPNDGSLDAAQSKPAPAE